MTYRFPLAMALMIAGQATALGWLALAGFSVEGGATAIALIVGGLVGLGTAWWVIRVEDRHREQAFDAMKKEGRRAERARIEAEFPDELAEKVADGAISKEEARRRHRSEQRGPADDWVP